MFLSDTRSSADLHPKRIPCSELQRESAAQLARGPERGPNSLEKQWKEHNKLPLDTITILDGKNSTEPHKNTQKHVFLGLTENTEWWE